MIIAVDFDGTIVEHKFPNIGKVKIGAIEQLINFQNDGCKLILWTCREDVKEGNFLTEAVEFCRERGLEFDAINCNLPESGLYTDSRKIYADLYIDDKAINCSEDFWLNFKII